MTDWIDPQGFRANVGIVLMRDGGELFLGGRRDGRGWQFPQGGVRRDEHPDEALYRELHEEVGLARDDVELLASTRQWLRYRLPSQFVRRRSGPLCIGQKQRWYLLRMVADESRLNFAATANPEFDSGRWVDYWSPVREVVYFKRAVYARALQELGEHAFQQGPPPRPEWWSEELLCAQEPLDPRRRRRRGGRVSSNAPPATDPGDAATSGPPEPEGKGR